MTAAMVRAVATRDSEVLVRVADPIDVFSARWAAQRIATAIGFASAARQEIAIVVSELATNILKYGVRGDIAMHRVDDAALGAGLELIAFDDGPPLTDLAMAIQDGCGDGGPIDPARQLGRGGIGSGLGAIIRLSDLFEYRPGPGRKAFRAVRFVRRPRRPGASP